MNEATIPLWQRGSPDSPTDADMPKLKGDSSMVREKLPDQLYVNWVFVIQKLGIGGTITLAIGYGLFWVTPWVGENAVKPYVDAHVQNQKTQQVIATNLVEAVKSMTQVAQVQNEDRVTAAANFEIMRQQTVVIKSLADGVESLRNEIKELRK